MKAHRFLIPLALAALLGACGARNDTREKIHRAVDNAAREAGQAAYVVTHGTKKAAQATTQSIREAGQQVKKGWQDGKHSSSH